MRPNFTFTPLRLVLAGLPRLLLLAWLLLVIYVDIALHRFTWTEGFYLLLGAFFMGWTLRAWWKSFEFVRHTKQMRAQRAEVISIVKKWSGGSQYVMSYCEETETYVGVKVYRRWWSPNWYAVMVLKHDPDLHYDPTSMLSGMPIDYITHMFTSLMFEGRKVSDVALLYGPDDIRMMGDTDTPEERKGEFRRKYRALRTTPGDLLYTSPQEMTEILELLRNFTPVALES